MTVYLLNTTILTTPGLTFESRYIGLVEAKSRLGVEPSAADRDADLSAGRIPTHIVWSHPPPDVVSAIGHQATAELASALLGLPVSVSGDAVAMVAGDTAVCVKLRGRPPEGAILSRVEVEAIGYDLVLLSALDPERLSVGRALLEQALELLAFPDDTVGLELEPGPEGLAAHTVALATGAQRVGTRRQGRYPGLAHYIVRCQEGYYDVFQEFGTGAWYVTELPEPEAIARYAKR
jgi:hypothetical protein